MTRARAKLLKQQVNLFLNDTLIDDNFILPKSYYLCLIRYEEEPSIARGGEEQLDMKTDVKMDVKLDMELYMKISHGRAREEREACARGEEEVQAGPAPGPTGRQTGRPGPWPGRPGANRTGFIVPGENRKPSQLPGCRPVDRTTDRPIRLPPG